MSFHVSQFPMSLVYHCCLVSRCLDAGAFSNDLLFLEVSGKVSQLSIPVTRDVDKHPLAIAASFLAVDRNVTLLHEQATPRFGGNQEQRSEEIEVLEIEKQSQHTLGLEGGRGVG